MASSSGANRGKRARGAEINVSIYPVATKGLNSSQKARYDILSLRKVQPCRYFDASVVDLMRIRRELESRLNDMGCLSLLTADWRSYKPMILEFLASFRFNEGTGEVQFRLGNHAFNINKGVICDIFNWPNEEAEIVPPYFEDELWESMTLGQGGSYDAHNSNIAEVPFFAYRYFHRVLTYTICGRSMSNSKVTKTDLEILYYFHNRKKADLAGILLRRFKSVQDRNVGAIGLGGFITAIAIHLANFDPHATSLDFTPGPNTVDSQVAVNMKLLAKGSYGQLYYVPEDNVAPDADSEDELEEEERVREEGEEMGEPSNVNMGDQQSYQGYGQPFTYEQFDARFSAFEQQVYNRVGNVEQEIVQTRQEVTQTREMLQRQQEQLTAYFAHMGFHPPPQ